MQPFRLMRIWIFLLLAICLACGSVRADLVVPLTTARDSLQARIDMLTDPELAEFSFTTFQLQTDDVGMLFISLIIDAAKRGVKVRGIIDNNIDNRIVGSTSPEVIAALQAAGIELRYFHPIVVGAAILQNPVSVLNTRMHDKLWYVRYKDGREAMLQCDKNMTNEFYPQLRLAIGYKHHTLRGQEAYIMGAAVQSAYGYNQLLWDSPDVATRAAPLAPVDSLKLAALDKRLKANAAWAHGYRGRRNWMRHAIQTDQPVEFLHDTFDENGKRVVTTAEKIYEMIKSAPPGTPIEIENFYLVMHPELKEALEIARANGNPVTILTNMAGANYPKGYSDATLVDLEAIRKTGVELYMLGQHRGTHAKIVVIGDVVILSSANLDGRSLNINSESGVIIRDAKVASVFRTSHKTRMRPAQAIINGGKIVADEINGVQLTSKRAMTCEDVFSVPSRRIAPSITDARRRIRINATRNLL